MKNKIDQNVSNRRKGLANFISQKMPYFLFGSFFFLAFWLFTIYVKSDSLLRFDFDMMVKIQAHIPRKLDTLFSFMSLLGSAEIIGIVLLAVLLIRRKIGGFVALFLFGFAHVIEIIGKAFLHQPPPPFMFHRYDLGFVFPSTYVQPGYSYPSGHSLRIVFLAVVTYFVLSKVKRLNPNVKRILYVGMIFFVLLMLLSRVSQ